MSEVVFNGVTKRYPNGFQAVTDLHLEINDGEFLVMVGPSGCGKSTTLRMIAGLETISDGELLIDGKRVNDVDPGQRDIAMVFQNYALYPQMTVEENIGFGLKVRKMPKAEIKERVAEAARILQLTELLKNKPGQLSGGQRQRVAMGRAIVRRPKVFLLDEPLSNLDAKLRVQTRGEISRIQRELGVTTFYVTHDQVEAMTMGDRVAVIKDGHLLQVDTPTNLYNHPSNVFVAAFIGSPSMNLMEAELVDERTLQLGSHRLDISAVAERNSALRSHVGSRVAVGIRPEALEDAELAREPDVATIEVPVSEVEALGPETIVYVTVDAPPVDAEDPDVNTEEQVQLEEGTSRVSCRFNPRTRVQVGDRAKVAVSTLDLHFFDLETKQAIGNQSPATSGAAVASGPASTDAADNR